MSHTNKTPPAQAVTVNLPGDVQDGTLYFDATEKTMVVFNQGAWQRVDNGNMHRRVVYDLYIMSGQSNMGGNGSISQLTTNGYNGSDLSQPQTDVLFQLNYHDSRTLPATTHVFEPLGSLAPGQTSGNNLHGPEISFADRMKNIRPDRGVAIVKYYVDGAGIFKFDKTTSKRTNTSNENNAWDGLTNSIDYVLQQAESLNLKFNPAGFVWFQGESDSSGQAAIDYEGKLTALLSNVRSYVNDADLPVVIIESQNLGATNTDRLNFATSVDNVVAAQQYTRLVETSHLTSRMNGNVHWYGAEHVTFGKQVADEMKLLQTGTRPFVPSDIAKVSAWYDMSDSTNTQNITTSESGNVSKISVVKNKIEWNTCDWWQGDATKQPVVSAGAINGLDTLLFDNKTTNTTAAYDNHSAALQTMSTRVRAASHGWWGSPFDGTSNTGGSWPTYADSPKSDTVGMMMAAMWVTPPTGERGGTQNGTGPFNWEWTSSAGNHIWRAYVPLTQTDAEGGTGVFFNHTTGNAGGWGFRTRDNEVTVYGAELSKEYYSIHKDFKKPSSQQSGGDAVYIDATTDNVADGFKMRNITQGNKYYHVGEAIYYNDQLTTEELQKLEGYLAHKWGCTDLLPSDHTYKQNIPSITI